MYSYIKNVFWLPQPNKVELYFSNEAPDINKVASVFVYAFNEKNELLMVKEPKGTWDVPGGGRENDETIIQTATRETLEEACVEIDNISVIAYQKLILKCDKPDNYKRPYPESYEIFVSASIKQDLPFKASDEMIERKYFPIEKAIQQEGIQFENRRVILDKILQKI